MHWVHHDHGHTQLGSAQFKVACIACHSFTRRLSMLLHPSTEMLTWCGRYLSGKIRNLNLIKVDEVEISEVAVVAWNPELH